MLADKAESHLVTCERRYLDIPECHCGYITNDIGWYIPYDRLGYSGYWNDRITSTIKSSLCYYKLLPEISEAE